MRRSERVICEHLLALRIGAVVFEPDGQVPPDFLVDGRIAVEARRLNQHEMVGTSHRGLEVTSIPLQSTVRKILREYGPAAGRDSWFVFYTFRRRLPPWKEVERLLRRGLREFVAELHDPPENVQVTSRLRLRFAKAGNRHNDLFVLGGYSDHDAGGFVVADVIENVRLCIAEKQRKVEPYRHRYSEWWLALEDLIAYAHIDADDVNQVRAHLQVQHDFAKVILVDPLDPTRTVVL